MSVDVHETKQINILKSDLQKYEKIFLVVDDEASDISLAGKFCKSEALQNTEKKVLLLSISGGMSNGNVVYRRIKREDMEAFQQIYYMYEFSDRFQILSKEKNYSGLFNFVDTGILTMEDVFTVLLY